MKQLMIDLETLGTHPGCVVLSIGAVQFDLESGKTGATFHERMCVYRSRRAGFHVESDTIDWWRRQDTLARELAFGGREDVRVVMGNFVAWMRQHFPTGGAEVFGNSARFDLNILEVALNRTGFRRPWNTRLEWDARTMFRFAPHLRQLLPFEGVKHDALADAIHQAKAVSAIWNACRQVDPGAAIKPENRAESNSSLTAVKRAKVSRTRDRRRKGVIPVVEPAMRLAA